MTKGLRFRDYTVRVWGDGDVSMSSHDVIEYGTLGDVDGVQCNADYRAKEYQEIYKAAQAVGDAFKRLDELIERNERRNRANGIGDSPTRGF